MRILPGWHPMVVHFPLALVVTAASFLLMARLLRQEHYTATLATVGTWNLCLGAIAALFALATGLAAAIDLHVGPAARQAISLHVKWAIFTTLALVLLAVWRGAGSAQQSRPSWVFVGILLAATAALMVTGYRGGQNVYRYGVGVHTVRTTVPREISFLSGEWAASQVDRSPGGSHYPYAIDDYQNAFGAKFRRALRCTRSMCQFLDQPIRVIDMPQRFGDARDVHGHRPVLAAVVAKIPAQRLDVSVENQADSLAVASDHGRA
jgi:uncharacterized membrane protein